MGRVEATMIVNAPVEAVWNALNDIDHTPSWVSGLARAEIVSSTPEEVVTAYRDYNRLGPFLQTTLWRITAFEPMTHQAHVSESSSLPSTITFHLSPDPAGTRVQMIVEYRFLPFLGFVSRFLEDALMNVMMQQVIEQNLANLDKYLKRKSSKG